MKQRHIETLKTIYKRLPPRVRGAIPADLELWLRNRLLPAGGLGKPSGRVQILETKLWGGYSRRALADLEALLGDPATGANTAAAAGQALARWHTFHGDYDTALVLIRAIRERQPARGRHREHYLREAQLLCRLGRGTEARALLQDRMRRQPFDVSAMLTLANSWNPAAGAPEPAAVAEAEMLARINAAFAAYDLAPIGKHDAAAPLSLDNLRGLDPGPGVSGPKVTVIVPLWNAEATILTALRGLAEQTYENLEVLVVDDVSSDGGPDLVAGFARADPRFRLLRQGVNGGSYVARNRALGEATGAFVTVHDSDDWSHPQKIARHQADLAASDQPFNISTWIRTTPELLFIGNWRPMGTLYQRNFSSVFFRRELMDKVGTWDAARISADGEFVNRVRTLYGLRRQRPFLVCPLAFGRIDKGSLTQTGRTHVSTIYHGLRREYHEAGDFWHSQLDGSVLDRGVGGEPPPYFPSPLAVRSTRPDEPEHDLLFIGDFNLIGGTSRSAMNMVAAARQAGLDVALLQYRRYDRDVTKPLKHEVRREAWERGVRIVAPGERVRARTVVVTYPPIFDAVMDRFPEIDHDRLVVVVNQMAERDLEARDVAYDPAQVRAHLTELLGSEGLWAPISARVRGLMLADPRYPAPIAETWTPLIDTDLWCRRRPDWRGDWRARPVIGRHGRDHPLKWPAEREALRAAYCAGRPCEVRFLGGAVYARKRVGGWPSNWRDEAYGARDVRDFLADLDFFLHFPDSTYIEEFGRAPMEAMAMGVPVILPPEFEPTFGPAALYCDADGVWPIIERLWRDRAAWEARVAAGRAFVQASCAYSVFPERIARLAAARPRPEAPASPAASSPAAEPEERQAALP